MSTRTFKRQRPIPARGIHGFRAQCYEDGVYVRNFRSDTEEGMEELGAAWKDERNADPLLAAILRTQRDDTLTPGGRGQHVRKATVVTLKQADRMSGKDVPKGEYKHEDVPFSEYWEALGKEIVAREAGMEPMAITTEIESPFFQAVLDKYVPVTT